MTGRKQEDVTLVAARAAMRVLPGLAWEDPQMQDRLEKLSLPVLRAVLTAGVASQFPNKDVLSAAAHASADAKKVAGETGSAGALSAAYAAGTTNGSGIESSLQAISLSFNSCSLAAEKTSSQMDPNIAFKAVEMDTDLIDRGETPGVYDAPLWPDENLPIAFVDFDKDLRNFWSAERSTWGFWLRWYEKMSKETKPISWELQRDVALISDKIWKAGAEAVASEISRLEKLHRTGVTPRLIQNTDGVWDVEESPTVPDEPLEFAVSSVEQSLGTALKLCSQNMFNEDSDEAQIIRSALEKHRSNPSMLAVSFWQACMSFQANLGTEYPKDDPNLVGLQNTLYTSIEEMCEHSDLIKKRIGRLAALTPKQELTEEDKADLRALPDETKDHLTEKAQEELVDAVEDVSGSQKPQRSLQARLANWVTTLGKGLDQGQKNEKRAKWLVDLGRRLMRVFFPGDGEDEDGDDTT